MDVEALFRHALSCLSEVVGDLLRAKRDPAELVFASFDGASALGVALIASDVATEKRVDLQRARGEVERMIEDASERGEELMVSLTVTKEILTRILGVANLDAASRQTLRAWLSAPLEEGHFRVVAIADNALRAASVDVLGDGTAGETYEAYENVDDDDDDAPISSSLLN